MTTQEAMAIRYSYTQAFRAGYARNHLVHFLVTGDPVSQTRAIDNQRQAAAAFQNRAIALDIQEAIL